MNHSDDKGLVLPPKIAELQVVIIPILYKEKEQNESILKMAEEMATSLRAAGVRVFVDDGPKKPGFKDNKYELEGTPLRLEVGPKDVAKRSTKYARRDNGAKGFLSIETLGEEVVKILDQMHVDLLEKATKNLYDNIVKCLTWEAFIEALGQGKSSSALPPTRTKSKKTSKSVRKCTSTPPITTQRRFQEKRSLCAFRSTKKGGETFPRKNALLPADKQRNGFCTAERIRFEGATVPSVS